jgi:hypothetical protein
MITDKRGRIKCVNKKGEIKFLSPNFVSSFTFQTLGWKVISTPVIVEPLIMPADADTTAQPATAQPVTNEELKQKDEEQTEVVNEAESENEQQTKTQE